MSKLTASEKTELRMLHILADMERLGPWLFEPELVRKMHDEAGIERDAAAAAISQARFLFSTIRSRNHEGAIFLAITDSGHARLRDLDETIGAHGDPTFTPKTWSPTDSIQRPLTDRVCDFLDERTLSLGKATEKVAAIADDEPNETVTTLCLSGAALDAWWDSLTAECKGEIVMDFYESRTALGKQAE